MTIRRILDAREQALSEAYVKGFEDGRAHELSAIAAAIGSSRFMDPPDGGDISLAEQVCRMREALEKAEAALAHSNVEPVRAFAKAVLHGDDEHRAWLIEAAEAFIANKPLPVPRGKGAAPPHPDASAGLIDAAEWHEELAKEKLEQAKQTPEDKKRRFLDISFFHDECASALRARATDRRGE